MKYINISSPNQVDQDKEIKTFLSINPNIEINWVVVYNNCNIGIFYTEPRKVGLGSLR